MTELLREANKMSENIVNTATLKFKSIPENVSLARVVAASFGAQVDLTINEIEELKVAISEAVSNAIIHGYQNDPEKVVELIITRYSDRLVFSVADWGIGIEDIQKALEPAYSTASDRMGLGFVFIQSFMDHLEIESEINKGTKVTMVKNLAVRQES